MRSPAGPLRALLLDCDGVIIDSEPLNFECWNLAFAARGAGPLRGSHAQLVGKDLDGIFALWGQPGAPEALRREVTRAKNEAYRRLASARLRAVAGVGELIARARALGLQVGVVSAGQRERLELNLALAGVAPQIDVIVSGEDGAAGRSEGAPALLKDYALAAARLGVAPGCCLAVEDSAEGAAAARAAAVGRIIGLTTSLDEATLLRGGAHRVLTSLAQLDLAAERALLLAPGAAAAG